MAQIQGGADFAQIAAEKSLDTGAKENGGDAGWAPRGSLDTAREDKLFALEPGGLTTFEKQRPVLRLPGHRKAGGPAGGGSAESPQ